MFTYAEERPRISSGVPISFKRGVEIMCATTTSNRPSKNDTVMLLPEYLLTLSWSFAP